MSKFLIVTVVVGLTGCGVKTRPGGNDARVFEVGATRANHFVVETSRANFIPGGSAAENSVDYTFRNAAGAAVDLNPYRVEVQYGMPDMPGMAKAIEPALVERVEPNRLRVRYPSIIHGSDSEPWRFEIRLYSQDGTLFDKLVYDLLVPVRAP